MVDFFGQILPEVGRGVVIDGDDEQGQPLSGGAGSEAGNKLRKAIDDLQHDLMKLEMHLIEQVDVRENIFHKHLFYFTVFLPKIQHKNNNIDLTLPNF